VQFKIFPPKCFTDINKSFNTNYPNNRYKFSSSLTENTLLLHYEHHLVYAVYFDSHTKHINTFFGQVADFLILNHVVRIVINTRVKKYTFTPCCTAAIYNICCRTNIYVNPQCRERRSGVVTSRPCHSPIIWRLINQALKLVSRRAEVAFWTAHNLLPAAEVEKEILCSLTSLERSRSNCSWQSP
jgi:hypothetical protein